MNINVLRNFQAHGNDLDQLIGVETELNAFASTFSNRQLQIPEWVGEQLTSIDGEVKTMVRAGRLAEIKMLAAQEAALMGREEKRNALAEKRKALEALL